MRLFECLPELGNELIEKIEAHSPTKNFSKNEYIVRQGELIHFLPIVTKGSIKVFNDEDTVQFLLYFISAGETCIFSFAHVFQEAPAEFSAVAEIDSELRLLPLHKAKEWYVSYPQFAKLLLQTYQKHYADLLHTTKQIICYNLEERLLTYLQQKSRIEQSNLLAISHQEVALDLGTSREVVTRLMKKLQANGLAAQEGRKIKLL